MTKLFWGFLFIMLDYTVHIGRCSFSLFPDFIGYILLASGCTPLYFESPHFDKAGGISIIAALITGILFVIGLVGIASPLLSIGELICFVMVCSHAVSGIRDTEVKYGRNLGGQRLYDLWITSIVLSVVSVLLAFIPLLNLFALPLLVATFVVHVIFLMYMRKCSKVYDELRRTQ